MKLDPNTQPTRAGLTQLELIFVVALMGLFLVAPLVALRGVRAETALRDAEYSITNALERARSRAATGYCESFMPIESCDHGVHIAPNFVEFFEGNPYSAGTVINIPSSVNITATVDGAPTVLPIDIYFERLTGATGSMVTITITNALGVSKTITVDANGTIQ